MSPLRTRAFAETAFESNDTEEGTINKNSNVKLPVTTIKD